MFSFHRSFVFVLALFAACGQPEIVIAPVEPTHEQQASEPTPEADQRLVNPAEVAAWRADVIRLAENGVALKARPTPAMDELAIHEEAKSAAEAWRFSKDAPPFLDPFAEVSGTSADAQASEQVSEDYRAGLLYAKLGDAAGLLGCITKLLDEGEIFAAAKLAVLLDDQQVLASVVDRLVKGDRQTKLFELFLYAFEIGRIDAAVTIRKHGSTPILFETHEWIRHAARQGKTEFLKDLVEIELDTAQDALYRVQQKEFERSQALAYLPADIVLLAKTDRVTALEYAKRVLEDPQANLLVVSPQTEGNDNWPVLDTVQFWELVKADPTLRELYKERTRQFVEEATAACLEFKNHAPSRIHLGPNLSTGCETWMYQELGEEVFLLHGLLFLVRASGDQELLEFWDVQLGVIGQAMPLEREIGRLILGRPYDQNRAEVRSALWHRAHGGAWEEWKLRFRSLALKPEMRLELQDLKIDPDQLLSDP